MSSFQEYSLLIAVSIPVAVLAAMNMALWVSGERDTLMIPGVMRFPSQPIPTVVEDVTPAVEGTTTQVSANDEERIAA